MVNTNPITTVTYKTVNGMRFASSVTTTSSSGKSSTRKIDTSSVEAQQKALQESHYRDIAKARGISVEQVKAEIALKEKQKKEQETITKEIKQPVQAGQQQPQTKPLSFIKTPDQRLPTSSKYNDPNFLLRNREQQQAQPSQPATIGGKDVLQAKKEFEQRQWSNNINTISESQERKASSKILYPFLNPQVPQEGFIYGAVAPVIDVISDVYKGISYTQPVNIIEGFVKDVYKASTTDKTFKELIAERKIKQAPAIVTTGVVLGTTALTVFGGPLGTTTAGAIGTTFAGISAKQKISNLQNPTSNQGELLGGLTTDVIGGVSSGLYTLKGVAQMGYNVKTRLTSPYENPENIYTPESMLPNPKLSKIKNIDELKVSIGKSTVGSRTVEPYTRYDIKIGEATPDYLIKTESYYAQPIKVSGYQTQERVWTYSVRATKTDPNAQIFGVKGMEGFEDVGLFVTTKDTGAMGKFHRLPGANPEAGYKFELFPNSGVIKPQVLEVGATGIGEIPKSVLEQPGFKATSQYAKTNIAPEGQAYITKRVLLGTGQIKRQLQTVDIDTVDPWSGKSIKAGQPFKEHATTEPELMFPEGTLFKETGKVTHTSYKGYVPEIKQFVTVKYDPLKGPTPEQLQQNQQAIQKMIEISSKQSEYASRPTSIPTPIIIPSLSNIRSGSTSIGTNRIVNFNTGSASIGQANSQAVIFSKPEPYRKDFQNKSGSFFGGDTTSTTSSFDRIPRPSNFKTPILKYTSTPISNIRPTSIITGGSSGGGSSTPTPPPPSITGGSSGGGSSTPTPPPTDGGSYKFEQSKFKSKLTKEKGLFDVYVRKKGKFVKAGEGFDLQTAIRKGKEIVGTTASASFKVVERKSQRVVNLQGLGLSNNRFYASRKESGVIIEKPSKRIKSLGELREITFKGIQTQRRTRF